jgi:putative Mn2+ efflux pump MntP
MPPRPYLITAVVVAVLVAASLPLTLGFSIIVWRWLFAAAACILVVVGAFRVAHGLRAPRWIGVALALPGLLWAANTLRLMSPEPPSLSWLIMSSAATQLAFLAAAAGALKLVETMSRPHAAFRFGYGLLAVCAFVVGIGLVASLMGWSFTKNALFATSVRALRFAAILVGYGAFIGTAVLVTMRRDIEVWAGAIISLIGIHILYDSIRLMFVVELRGDLMFWVQPVIMLIGGAAVWRIGSVLNAQAVSERYAQS